MDQGELGPDRPGAYLGLETPPEGEDFGRGGDFPSYPYPLRLVGTGSASRIGMPVPRTNLTSSAVGQVRLAVRLAFSIPPSERYGSPVFHIANSTAMIFLCVLSLACVLSPVRRDC